MRLKDEEKLSFGCFACTHAGNDWVLWPRAISFQDGIAVVDLYVKRISGGFNKRNARFCTTHFVTITNTYTGIAQQEVDLARAFDQYVDRMER